MDQTEPKYEEPSVIFAGTLKFKPDTPKEHMSAFVTGWHTSPRSSLAISGRDAQNRPQIRFIYDAFGISDLDFERSTRSECNVFLEGQLVSLEFERRCA